MITMQSWMFLSSYEALRRRILDQIKLLSMTHLGPRAFDSIGGEVVTTTAFVLENTRKPEYRGAYLRLLDGKSESEKESAICEAIKNPDCGWFYRTSAADFKKIPGSPIAYWVSERIREVFKQGLQVGDRIPVRQGLATADNDQFLRFWPEVNQEKCGYGIASRDDAFKSGKKWFPYNKGGVFRKWFGNNEYLVNWENDGCAVRAFGTEKGGQARSVVRNPKFYFLPSVTWSFVSSSYFGVRHSNSGAIFDVGGSSAFPSEHDRLWVTGFLCSKLAHEFLRIINPTLNFQVGNVASLPILEEAILNRQSAIREVVELLILYAENDWNSYETSWGFTNLSLLKPDYRQSTLETTYQKLRSDSREMTLEMQRLEQENNQIFIDAYGLQGELTPVVPLSEITLTCNPHYRYGGDKREEEREALLLADTMRELISYAVGCMFGRYALDVPGLILANQGETLTDYLVQVAKPTFTPDNDNVIPMIDFEGDWFEDDISERFKQFLRVTFGGEHFAENLAFIEESLSKDIKKFLLKDFYNDHVKRYKKRPIYWLFSSSKGTFNALIYMHRYRSDTASIVLNDYLREFRTKLQAREESYEQVSISRSTSQKEKTQALKMIDKIKKAIDEVNEYEREVLYPLASQNIDINLDDGVKQNYPLFGKALKKVSGLS